MAVYPADFAHAINGAPGRLLSRTTKPGQAPGLWFNQRWISESRAIDGYGPGARIRAEIRFDDECGNRHNTFSVTGEIFRMHPAYGRSKYGRKEEIAGGCLHDDIARAFPELAHLIRWHLTSTDEPMHYVANAVYLAGDRDHRGLRKGEQKPLIHGRTGRPCWQLVAVNAPGVAISKTPTGDKYRDLPTVPLFILDHDSNDETPPPAPVLEWRVQMIEGEGKARELDSARKVAVWPEATDEELCQEPDALRAVLLARLPALMAAYRVDIEAAGFLWEPPPVEEVAA